MMMGWGSDEIKCLRCCIVCVRCADEPSDIKKNGEKPSSGGGTALDPQFAKAAHVHPSSPVPCPLSLHVRTVAAIVLSVSSNTEPSAGDHDLPCAATRPGQPCRLTLSLRQSSRSGRWRWWR